MLAKIVNIFDINKNNWEKFGNKEETPYLSHVEKILSLENEKKNEFLFCILLTYSYLCSRIKRLEL